MYQLDELEINTGHCNLLEERIVGLIHTSPHLAELFSEVCIAVQNRAAKPSKGDRVFFGVKGD